MNRANYSTDWTAPTTVLERFGDAMELLCQGTRPPDWVLTQWLRGNGEELQDFANDYGPAWAQGIGIIEAALTLVDTPTDINFFSRPGVDHQHRVFVQTRESL
jgi:hypothetical protein